MKTCDVGLFSYALNRSGITAPEAALCTGQEVSELALVAVSCGCCLTGENQRALERPCFTLNCEKEAVLCISTR